MALNNITQILAAGFEEGQIGLLSAGGYPMGLTGALAEGASAGLYAVKGVRAANPTLPQPETTTIMGNNRALGVFQWKPGALPEFDLDLAVNDQDLAAAVEGVKARDLDKWTLHALGGDEVSYEDAMLLLSTHAQSQEQGSDGLSLWYHILIPVCQLSYVGPQGLNMRGENIFRFHVTVRPTSKFPWGEAFSVADDGVTRAVMFEWTSEHKLAMDTLVCAAATAQITLSYTPAMDTVTAGSGILFYVDGTETALTGVTPATKIATFTAPGTGGEVGVVIYERAA